MIDYNEKFDAVWDIIDNRLSLEKDIWRSYIVAKSKAAGHKKQPFDSANNEKLIECKPLVVNEHFRPYQKQFSVLLGDMFRYETWAISTSIHSSNVSDFFEALYIRHFAEYDFKLQSKHLQVWLNYIAFEEVVRGHQVPVDGNNFDNYEEYRVFYVQMLSQEESKAIFKHLNYTNNNRKIEKMVNYIVTNIDAISRDLENNLNSSFDQMLSYLRTIMKVYFESPDLNNHQYDLSYELYDFYFYPTGFSRPDGNERSFYEMIHFWVSEYVTYEIDLELKQIREALGIDSLTDQEKQIIYKGVYPVLLGNTSFYRYLEKSYGICALWGDKRICGRNSFNEDIKDDPCKFDTIESFIKDISVDDTLSEMIKDKLLCEQAGAFVPLYEQFILYSSKKAENESEV